MEIKKISINNFVILSVLLLASCNKETIENSNNEVYIYETTLMSDDKIETTEQYKISEHIEDWRINDINSYQLMIKTILSNFENYDKGVFYEKFWFTEQFRSSFKYEDFDINFSMNEHVKNREWYAIKLMDPFEENTENTLANKKITFYTVSIIDNIDRYLNKYTFEFEIDKDNRLDSLTLVSKDIVRKYQEENEFYKQMFYSIVKQVNIDKNNDISDYKIYFTDECFKYLSENNFFDVSGNNKNMIELKIRETVSNSGKIIFNAILDNDAKFEYIVFAYYYEVLDGKISFCNDYDESRIEYLSEYEYNMPDDLEEETW